MNVIFDHMQVHESERVHVPPVPSFDWVAIENVTSLVKCRNSVQGPQLIADELGNTSNTFNHLIIVMSL